MTTTAFSFLGDGQLYGQASVATTATAPHAVECNNLDGVASDLTELASRLGLAERRLHAMETRILEAVRRRQEESPPPSGFSWQAAAGVAAVVVALAVVLRKPSCVAPPTPIYAGQPYVFAPPPWPL